MVPVVVDTNVVVVANGRGREPSGCVNACAARLHGIRRQGTVVLDAGREIITEYVRNVRSHGEPGAGDRYIKWVLRNLTNPDRCALVSLSPHEGRGFEQFPDDPRLAAFDPDDRVFIAVSRAHLDGPPVLQALDSEWWGFRAPLADNGVNVEFLCPDEIERLHAGKHGGG